MLMSFAACLSVLGVVPGTLAQSNEVRGLWITRFEWPSSNAATCRNLINSIMDALQAAHFNSVFFQIRGQADVLYPSPYEVWSPLIGGHDPGWDPLAYAIAAAHARGLEFHAYINTHTCWQGSSPPSNPDHVYYKHCDATNSNARDWLIHDGSGNPVQYAEDTYVWFAPGVPAFQSYLRQQILYVVENYDVDGVHFDRIRTPNSLYSYDPISMARMANPRTNPASLSFHEWTADQITRNVRDIYAAVMAVKPWVKVSAAVFPNPVTAPLYQHQNATAWLAAGALDVVVAMDYSAGGQGSSWDNNLQNWLSRSNGRHVVMGQHAKNTFDDLFAQIELVRMRGGAGTNLFSWSTFTPSLRSRYATTAYPTAVPPKPMPWKDTPTTAIIQGFVKDIVGNEVVDAQTQRSGSPYVALSSGDGYYAHLLVPPGTYGITSDHPDYAPISISGISVAAGDVKWVDLVFTTVLVPKARLVADNTTVIIGNPVILTPNVALPAGDSMTSWTLDFDDKESLTGSGPPTPAVHIYTATGSYQASFTMTTALFGTLNSKLVVSIVPPPPIPGDFDGDRDVDLEDFGRFQACLSGHLVPQNNPACASAKLAGHNYVDQADMTRFRRCLSGADIPADPNCAD